VAGKANPQPLDHQKALTAVLALLIAERQERLDANGANELPKTEVILASAGLQPTEIAPLVSKNYEAVKKTIQRGRPKPMRKPASRRRS